MMKPKTKAHFSFFMLNEYEFIYRECQRRSKLGKFGGLQTDRAHHQPRTRSFRIRRYKDGDNKQHNHPRIYNVREHIVHPVFQHQQNKPQPEGADNPYELFSGTGREIKEVTIAIVIARTANAEPSADNQKQIDTNRYPIQCFPQTIVPRYHIR